MKFVQETVIAGRTPEDVWAYVTDFNRAHEWRSEVTGSTMQPPGPMRLGSRLREVAVVSGRTVVTESVIDSFEPPHRWTFAHLSGALPVRGGIVLAAEPGGTRLTYELTVQLTGGWRLLAPMLRWSGRRMIRGSLATLADLLSGQPATPGSR
jgi:Polyketide cyclase / dehydrase and lipid transport